MSSNITTSCPGSSAGVAGQSFLAAVQFFAAQQCLITEPWPQQADVRDDETFDMIVVGGGATGSVLAGRLSEIQDWNVLLIEAGGNPPLESIIPYYWSSVMQSGQYSWNYTTTSDGKTTKGFNNGIYRLLRGRLLGGCSSTNGMLYVRGDQRDYNAWYEAGNEGWDWGTVFHYMKKAETLNDQTIDTRARSFHGSRGPVSIARYNYSNPEVTDNLIKSFGELGLQMLSDINGPTRLGVTRVRGHLFEGRRMSMAKAYLNPARDRPNLHVLTNTLVTEILIDKLTNKTTGVKVILQNGTEAIFNAKLEVIVSGGTINSPQLLMLSGIGPKAHLESLGIDVKKDLPVGQNYQDHGFVPFPIMADGGESPSSKDIYFESIKYLYNQTGMFASNAIPDLVATHTVTPGVQYPEFEHTLFHFANNDTKTSNIFYTNYNFVDSVVNAMTAMNVEKQVFLFTPIILHPASRGYVKLNSTDPTAKPIIFPNQYSNLSDIDTMVRGLKLLSNIVNTTYFRSINASMSRINLTECNDYEFLSDDYWACSAYHLTSSYLHPVGTCKMGPKSDPTSVVDSNLIVHGIANLRVVDASIMPTLVSGNPQATCVMIGEKISDVIKKTYSKV